MGERLWKILLVCTNVGTLAVASGGVFLWRRDVERGRIALEETAKAVREEIRAAQTFVPASQDDVMQSCQTSGSEFMCTWTNRADKAVSVCARGRLSRPDIENAKSRSMPACSGRLGLRETKTVSAPWLGLEPKKICVSQGRFGKELDWSVCDFKVETVDLATVTTGAD